MPGDAAEARVLSLATVPATAGERRLALMAIVVSAVLFAAMAPFAKARLPDIPAFLPIYQSALVVCDLITVALLLGQYGILRSAPLLALAGGYLFSAAMATAHALSFPGLFAPTGLLGAGPQTTAWIYFLWHLGFPAALIGYAFAWDAGRGPAGEGRRSPGAAMAAAAVIAVGAAVAFTLLATAGQALLPSLMQGDGDLPAKYAVAWITALAALAAVPAIARRRPLSMLDLWLMVVACAWFFDVALAAVFNAGRYSVGWYGGRAYGLLASTFVLGVLLMQDARLYGRTRELLVRSAERLRILHSLEHAVAAQRSPEEIAAAVIRPLRELLGVARVVVNEFHLERGEAEWLAAAGRRRTHVGRGVRYSLRLMGDVEALRRGEVQRIVVRELPESEDRQALLASDVHEYLVMPMRAGGELFGGLSFGARAANFSAEQLRVAEEVATQLAIAMLQARLLERLRGHAQHLEEQVRARTEALTLANKELESFSYSVSHDLRAPLRAIDGFARMLEEDYAPKLDEEGRRLLAVVRENALRMGRLIDDLLAFSRLARQDASKQRLDMGLLAREVAAELANGAPARIEIGALPVARADRSLMRQVWSNLIGNAIKYSSKNPEPRVEIGGRADGGENIYWVRDNGVGFDMRYVGKLFGVFQRLHSSAEFDGTGVGLAIVQRVVARHGGRVRAESAPGEGARFEFSLPKEE